MADLPVYLTRSDIAELFRTSVGTVRQWLAKGVLPPPELIGREPALERWRADEVLRAVGAELDAVPRGRARSADPDEAMRRMRREAAEQRQGSAKNPRRRNDAGIPLSAQ